MPQAPGTARLRRLKRRPQFLKAARGRRAGRAGIGLQAAAAGEASPGIGFTVTKKTGNAPERNRIRRRLRAAAAACADDFRAQHDYVILGRREALARSFDGLVDDLRRLVKRIHDDRAGAERTGPPKAASRNRTS